MLLGICALTGSIAAQSVYDASFNQTLALTTDSVSVQVRNILKKSVTYTMLKNQNTEYKSSAAQITLPADGSVPVIVKYAPVQNVVSKDVLVFLSSDSSSSFVIAAKGSGKYNDSYQDITFNKYDSSLFVTLNSLVTPQTALGYNGARDKMFMEFDKLPGDSVECVYTGKKVHLTSRADAQSQGMNTEHTWPQSNFNSADPMVSDLYHLYITDETPNGKRSNYPFGMVVPSTVTYSAAGSMLGKNQYGAIVFEPRDVHKGNVARSLLYFQIRHYANSIGTYFDTLQESTFRVWNKLDTVDAKERARCTAIAALQGKRNPLIDHPEFVDRIFSFNSFGPSKGQKNRTLAPKFVLYPPKLVLDSAAVGDTAKLYLNLVNLGNAASSISAVSVSNKTFSVTASTGALAENSARPAVLSFVPASKGGYTDTLSITADGKTYTYPVSVTAVTTTTGIVLNDNAGKGYALSQNYPNPFNATTMISYSLPVDGKVSLKIFNMLGKEAAVLVNEYKPVGNYEVTFNAASLSSGVYFYELRAGAITIMKKMTLLK